MKIVILLLTMVRSNHIFILIAALAVSCGQSGNLLFERIDASHSGISFANDVVETDSMNLAFNYYFYNGAGVSIADFNNDGLDDVFLLGNHVPSRFYLNKGNLTFDDVTEKSGLWQESWVSGATFGDVNGDGLEDIYLCTVGKGEYNLLYINQGNDKNGIPIFREMAEAFGLKDEVISTQAAFVDIDLDNDLDLFLAVNSQLMNNRNETVERNLKKNSYTVDKLYRNNGDDTFTDISVSAGINNEGYSLGLAINDINNDGWPDIYVANDFLSNDLIYLNKQDGTFDEKAGEYLRHASQNGMGVDIADVNNDGLMDITVMDMLPESNRRRKLMMMPINYDLYEYRKSLGYIPQHVRNTLQINKGRDFEGKYHFSEIGCLAGMYSTDWSWAPLWADFDNSGTLDLFITNGYNKDLTDLDFSLGLELKTKFGNKDHMYASQMEALKTLRPIKTHNYFYLNAGGLQLSEVSKEIGLGDASFSHGTAFSDLDNDGDLDLVVNNLTHEAFLYRNTSNDEPQRKNFLKIKLTGPGKNTNALGTRLILYQQGVARHHYHSHVRGYLSSMGETIHFGLGTSSELDSLKVIWPGGRSQSLRGVKANQTLNLDHEAADRVHDKAVTRDFTFKDATNRLQLDFEHTENKYTDYKNDPLFLKMYSRDGPGVAIGDINGDLKDDIVIGGAKGLSTLMFVQNNGRFGEPVPLNDNSEYEDMGVLLFDVDDDGDNDLFVVSGGIENPAGGDLYQDRLYLNDGHGNFMKDHGMVDINSSGSVVKGADFDRDGDVDLFVGGKMSPGKYPEASESMLLANDQGELSIRPMPVLQNLGMVSDAIWTDFNNDSWPDLIVVGEWMNLTFLKNNNGQLEDATAQTGMGNTSGWWNSITAGDFDSDGDMDYITGNFGLNSFIKSTEQTPVRLYAGDYDDNEKIDPILSYYSKNDEGKLEEFPVHTRDALIDQIVGYKRRFKDYQSFAVAGFSEVLKSHERKNVRVLEAGTLTTSYIENLGHGRFKLSALPWECQVAPVFGVMVDDFDGDGNLDAVISGNVNCAEPLFGNYDASDGVLLLGRGDGKFSAVPGSQSGLFLAHDQKSMASMVLGDQNFYLALANSGPIKILENGQSKDKSLNIVNLKQKDEVVEIEQENGKTTRYEFYLGNGYLSQSSRKLRLKETYKKVVVKDFQNGERTIK